MHICIASTTGQDYFYGVHGVAKDTHLGLRWATKAADAGDRCGGGLRRPLETFKGGTPKWMVYKGKSRKAQPR